MSIRCLTSVAPLMSKVSVVFPGGYFAKRGTLRESDGAELTEILGGGGSGP